MITIYQVIQVVFWFYSSITFASVVVCMHANWSWSQVLHISYLGIDTATQRRVLQLYIAMSNPFVGCMPCPICVLSIYNSGVNFWSKTVKSFSGTQLICITSSSQQMLTLYSAINQLIWQPCLHASKKKLTHGWCSIFIMLLDKVTRRPFSGL